MKRLTWVLPWPLIVLLLIALLAQAGGSDKAPARSAEQRQRDLESFEEVWRTIRDKHFDPKLGGLDWQAIHDELRPKVEKATTTDQAREIMEEMISRLGQSHFEIIPAAAYREIEQGAGADNTEGLGRGEPGLEARIVEGVPVVTKIQEGMPAAKLGVRTGWQILRVAGKDLASVLAKVRAAAKDSHFLDYQLQASIAGRLRGKVGAKLAIVFENGEGKEVALDIPLAVPTGTPARFGNLPTFYVAYESRKLAGNIAYFSFNAFFDPPRVIKALGETVKANADADGFILDLRGNPGGIGAMAVGVGNWFVTQPKQKLGSLITRDTTMNFTLNPRAEAFRGPLAILADGMSGSTAEILTGGLQDLKRARVFGTRTAGAALPAGIVRLPNGDGFLFAFANYISEGGKPLEANGVKPDEEIPLRRQTLLKGEDTVLDAAVKWIHSQKKTGSIR